MMLGKMPVQVVRGHQLQHRVAEELHTLVRAHSQVGQPEGAVGHGPGQEADVGELDPDLLLKGHHLFQDGERLDPMAVAPRLLHLEGVRVELGPRLVQARLRSEQGLGEHLVRLVDAAVQVDGAHQGLEAVGHGVTQFCVMAQVRPMGV